MSEAIKQGGGQQVASAYLGSGATHVVCQPQAAGRWLSMGEQLVCNIVKLSLLLTDLTV